MVASSDTIAIINNAAAQDDEYVGLNAQIVRGWPDNAANVTTYLRPYYTFADELSVSCGLVFKGHRLVVPQPLRAYLQERLHAAHTGVNACQRRARETVYWPAITVAIKRTGESCAVCASHQHSMHKEPLMSYPPSARPWEVLGVDIFTIENTDYFTTVDYLTGWFEIDRLGSKSVSNIVYCLRQHFARHGLPLEVVTDNSPFASAEFHRFVKRFEFRHTASSPRYPQSNGRVDFAVKTAKRLMIKAQETSTDPFLALLEWRKTPSESFGQSPAQQMLGRRCRTLLPTGNTLLDTPTSSAASDALARAKIKQAVYYNRTAKERPPLSKGDTVRVKFDDRPDWRKAEISQVLSHRSYNVRFEDGTVQRRTSKHVRFSAEPPIIVGDDSPPPNNRLSKPSAAAARDRTLISGKQSTASSPAAAPPSSAPTVTGFGRIVRLPARYSD
jgi:hypothetical protein